VSPWRGQSRRFARTTELDSAYRARAQQELVLGLRLPPTKALSNAALDFGALRARRVGWERIVDRVVDGVQSRAVSKVELSSVVRRLRSTGFINAPANTVALHANARPLNAKTGIAAKLGCPRR
jgi:hypothetical protein